MILTITLNASIDKTAIINNFKTGKINRLDKPLEFAGGKGLNVTRALKNLGYHDTLSTGFVGGKNGEKLKILMDLENINHDFFEINDETRCCLAIIDNELNKITELNENGPNISLQELNSFMNKLENLLLKTKVMVISGSVPESLPENIYYDIITLAKKNNIVTVLDAKGKYLKNGIGAYPYIIKPNQYEAEELLDFSLDSQESWLKGIYFLCNYCSIAVITLENKGCVIGTKNEIYHLTPPQIKLVNSVGSGDSFLAGLVYGLVNNKSLKDSGILAIATGTANAQTMQAGHFDNLSIEDIVKEVKIEKLL
ncbi:MAG: 1-phosphofructokinase family hexose kinase [Candidatus Sericytochromatia bacterium]|nr:1-phosphofructokinase family hexose kinase [Candidatus Sericytochromatia bacterium]